jgi:putative redox protein
MVTITIDYQGELHCRAQHEPSGSILETDAPKDNMGKGENFSPTDLVATALGSCILTLMGIAARKLQLDLTGTRVTVQKEMTAVPVRRIAKLSVRVVFPRPIEEEHKPQLEKAALTCPVHQSLHPDIAIPMEFVWA